MPIRQRKLEWWAWKRWKCLMTCLTVSPLHQSVTDRQTDRVLISISQVSVAIEDVKQYIFHLGLFSYTCYYRHRRRIVRAAPVLRWFCHYVGMYVCLWVCMWMCEDVIYRDKTKTPDRNNLKHGTLVVLDTVSSRSLLISGSKGQGSGSGLKSRRRCASPASTPTYLLVIINFDSFQRVVVQYRL